ncbi:Putative auto-transporter adhesin, head GIN domain [Parasphingorhabdus marina DSM 22363]|uniref:Putative auto-transporter adhesin, head GIN domain n=1 Tax=Parasphingorhabdus marina DSM 22363 TaxID=1123272 RepID=A0A1N6CU50_9SPHN|nr:DUF2807 domain-containing protein [Parasphingorhabdus marina]SIN61999.1 Putative auto-transporter adhesin, head GIN domain [Parasphingorhabdus marina DSM 22363]
MIRSAIIASTLSLALIAAPASAAERKYSIFGFDKIRINNGVNVVITTGEGPAARADGQNREILDRVSLRKAGDQLTVSVKPLPGDSNNFTVDQPVTLYLSTYRLKSVTHLGSGLVRIDRIDSRNPSLRVGGFGSVTVDELESDTVNIAMNGGGDLTISGETGNARVEMLGSSILRASGLTAENLVLRHRGPASSHLTVERQADISNSGTGQIQIDGRPNCTVRTDGAAQIVCNPKH